MKATEQYFPVELFIMMYKVVLTFESVDKSDQFFKNYDIGLIGLIKQNFHVVIQFCFSTCFNTKCTVYCSLS